MGERQESAGPSRSQLERADFFVQFVCGYFLHPNHGQGDQGSSFSASPSLLQLGKEFCSLCKHRVLKAAVPGDKVEGTALFLGGESGHKLPDPYYLLSREGIIKVVRQNTWNLGLFWSSVVRALTFPLSQGCAGGKQCAPVKGFCFHSATDTAPSCAAAFSQIDLLSQEMKGLAPELQKTFPPLFLY